MARQAANLEDALNKKGGLTLSQLANYDDWATDALVDKVCIRAARQNICAILTECDRFTSGQYCAYVLSVNSSALNFRSHQLWVVSSYCPQDNYSSCPTIVHT